MPGPLPPPPPSWMLTHRYTRRHLAHHNTADPYNTLLTAHDSKNHEKSNTTTPSLEYWTNGTTTHLVTVPVEPPTSSFLYQSQQASPTQTVPQRQQQEKPSRTNRVVRNSLIAGSFSGMASTITLYPLDVLRTKLQAAAAASGNQHTTHHSGTSALRTVWHETWRLGGWRALYTGLSLPLAAQVVYKSSIFTIVNVTQSWLLDWKRLEREKLGLSHTATTLTYADTAVTGFTAGAINGACFVTPVELVRNQMIAHDSQITAVGQRIADQPKITTWDVVRGTIRTHGWTRLWRGLGVTVARDGIGVAAFFCTKRAVEETFHPEGPPSFATTLLAGALAGLSFWVVSLPMDTMKTWIQSGDLHCPAVNVSYELRQTYHQRGGGLSAVARRLLRGWQVAYSRGMPSAALTIATYSTLYRALEGCSDYYDGGLGDCR